VQPVEVGGREVDVGGRSVLFHARRSLGSRDRDDVLALGQQPRQGKLAGCHAPLSGNGLYLGQDRLVAVRVVAVEPRIAVAQILGAEAVRGGRGQRAGEEATAEWAVGDQADAEAPGRRKHVVIDLPPPQ